jgi:hypothetical protein
LHSEVRVALFPHQVALRRVERSLGLRGLVRRPGAAELLDADAAAGPAPWSGALAALEAAAAGCRGAYATVILSNHFVRYALVPWSGDLADEQEEAGFARHCFLELYGEAAAAWELRVSPGKAGAARLASGVDAALLAALRESLGRAQVVLYSIQPHLMAAVNACRARLGAASAWFALLEPGHLCLGLLRRGEWLRIRGMRIGAAWAEELPVLLEREALLAGPEGAADEVFLWAPQLEDTRIAVEGRWRIVRIEPDALTGWGGWAHARPAPVRGWLQGVASGHG